GPAREDVPSNSLLGEGLTGENNRLKRGLQSRTPTIPLLSLRGCGGGDVPLLCCGFGEEFAGVGGEVRPCVVPVSPPEHPIRGVRCLLGVVPVSVSSPLAPDHFPFCPGELVDSLPHIV